jgi:hypothetical protein
MREIKSTSQHTHQPQPSNPKYFEAESVDKESAVPKTLADVSPALIEQLLSSAMQTEFGDKLDELDHSALIAKIARMPKTHVYLRKTAGLPDSAPMPDALSNLDASGLRAYMRVAAKLAEVYQNA